MKTIWKFSLGVMDEQTIPMPIGAHILHVARQGGVPQLWAEVMTNTPTSPRVIRMFGTGHPMPNNPGRYIGTFQMLGDALVFHVYETE